VIHRTRIVFTVGALAVASAAAATIPWQTWKPVTACLLCGVQDSGEAVVATPPDASGSSRGDAGLYARNSAESYTPGALPGLSSDTQSPGAGSSASRLAASPKGWQPWGNASGTTRFAASGASGHGHSAPTGGLWQLMSLHPHHGAGTAAGSGQASVHVSAPPVSRPVKTPAPGANHSTPPSSSSSPAPSSGGGSAGSGSGGDSSAVPSVPSVGSGMGGIPPTDTFHEHQTPPPDPFRGPGGFDPGAPAGGPGSIGGSGGGKGLGGGRVSAAPEPGSMLLLGTGMLGLFGMLRKRRLI
jgi:translation initiation factor IF-2